MVEDKQIRLLRQLPSVNELLQIERVKQWNRDNGIKETKIAIEESLSQLRQKILSNEINTVTETKVLENIGQYLSKRQTPSLQRVINATGVVLHTNLGRSLLSPTIKDYLNEIMFSYSNLEYDLKKKKRGLRYYHVEKLLQELTGAEDAIVVNNNAAAVMLVLDTFVQNKEVIISRGELVEIGGSFRIPEIVTKGGGTLKEVGTTNKTHLNDYQNAITEQTGAILKVHTSNYRIVGFTEKPSTEELYQLAQSAGIPMINDLGSGLFIDLSKYGLPKEPLIQEAVSTSDIVTFSGDKLLGGPQAGIIAGKKEMIEKIKHNQLLRALRVDKMTLAALEATLQLYLNPEKVLEEIPTLKMITISDENLMENAKKLAEMLNKLPEVKITIEKGTSQVGGGSFPGYLLPTYLVKLCLRSDKRISVTKLEKCLRCGEQPIIARLEHDSILFDVRTLQDGEDELIYQQLKKRIKGE
ncbi:L-seryl-tRNA(Sec) selenium transferase [Limosilactobacillus reuteri]|nr:L-seryl-tRNA(Sec) selenium transferase [Limosilactobacillus reuteri]OTA74253.1 L-seryl-tRNA(Sec) selenium transferase [Limosilactobacillus reuteri]OTA80003.1 L-seryl-tRNA(Sec) selenium transferase [Limosilactobacillus reuteri]